MERAATSGSREPRGATGASATVEANERWSDPRAVTGGTYTLVVALRDPATVTFGAAGERDLPAGWYAYTGSALGTGGFSRVERHRELARGERDVRHWHVDYLLGHPASAVETDVRSAGADVECAVARDLAARLDPVAGLGASDCDCATHLARGMDRERVRAAVERSHGRARE